jgi:hypothetical protein
MKLAKTLLAACLTASAFGSAAQPSLLVNAKVTVRAAEPGGLEKELRAPAAGPTRWVAYTVQGNQDGHVCCYQSIRGDGTDDYCCGGCHLESGKAFSISRRRRDAVQLEGRSDLNVFYRIEDGRVTNVRVFSGDCGIDAGGREVVSLTNVTAKESVAFLASLVAAAPNPGRRKRHKAMEEGFDEDGLAEHALTALALHSDTSADRVLEDFLAPARPIGLRKKAAFWIGNSRGRSGFEILKRVVPNDADADFRHHGTFAISQSGVPEATELLLGMARRDPEAEVRGQALFWLAQKAGDKVAAAIEGAIEDDPDTEVKVKAVFALTQLPANQGVPHLIKLARTHRTPEVREKAIFWLGQSNDPRALDFIEEVLSR